MRKFSFLRGFSSGVAIGVLVGSAGMAAAAFGYKGWQVFSNDFKGGYVSGFLDMANLARNLQPGGWVDDHYAYLPGVRVIEWKLKLDEIYSKPENQKYSVESALQLAGHELEEKHGKSLTPEERERSITMQMLAARRKKQIEEATAKGLPPPPEIVMPDASVPAHAPRTAGDPNKPKVRKWCRCDGTDPKLARQQRKARAAEEAAKKTSTATNPGGADGKKTDAPPKAVVPAPAPAGSPAQEKHPR
jgi:hypothetical protein